MRKEIGSEFWNVPVCDKNNDVFSANTSWFLSGRSALRKIILDLKENHLIKTVAIPSWCCDSIIIPFIEADIEVQFYPVLGERQDLSNVETDAILIMDYFGYTGQSRLDKYKGIVIRDVTHSIFSKTYCDADYYFGSLRKWAGFLTGGFAISVDAETIHDTEYENIRHRAMDAKCNYMVGQSNSKEYLKLYSEAEEYLDLLQMIYTAAEEDVWNAQHLDVDFIQSRRKTNAQKLLNEFRDIAIFKEMKENDCPMFVPIIVPDGKRDELRRYLITNEIYCPVHWPVSKYHNLDINSKNVYENGLSLVCDQRYMEKDMERMIDVIKQFWRE